VRSKGEYLLWFGIGLAMSFVLARYFGLAIDWHLVTGAPPGVLSAARVGWVDCVRAEARCAGGDTGDPIPNHNGRSFTLVVEWRLPTDLLMSTTETYMTMRLPPASNFDIERPPSPSTSPTRSRFCLIACISVCVVLSGCETLGQRVKDKEDLLAAAGFTVQPANTPQRLASLRALPANKFVPKAKGDGLSYIYADPVVCNCLYVGDQTAFNAYKKEVFTRNIVDEQQLTAETYNDQWNWAGWDWGAWGPRGWW
jgi:hypothetical protein